MTTEKETLKKVREIIEELKREDEECRSVICIDYYDLINEIKELEGEPRKMITEKEKTIEEQLLASLEDVKKGDYIVLDKGSRKHFQRGYEAGKSEAIKQIKESIILPCCHISGMHDPEHFDKGTGICDFQIREAFYNLIKFLEIEEVVVKSKEDCYWCNYNKEHPNEKTNHSIKEFIYNFKTKELKSKIRELAKEQSSGELTK